MFGMSERLKLHSHAEIDICIEWEKNCKGRIDETFTAPSFSKHLNQLLNNPYHQELSLELHNSKIKPDLQVHKAAALTERMQFKELPGCI
jgi:hypothetical protein